MGLGGHLSQQDKELIEAGVHPVIDEKYKTRPKCDACGRPTTSFTRKLDGSRWCKRCQNNH